MNKYKKNIGTFVLCVVVFITVMVLYYFYNRSTENYNIVKEDDSKPLIYTISEEQYGYYFQYIPYFNIKGEFGEALNNDVVQFVSTFEEDNIGITYESDLNGKILSLVIIVEDHGYLESANIIYFRSYNINVETQDIINDEKLFNYFETDSDVVNTKLENGIKDFYQELVNDGTYDSKECDYNCFKRSREFNDGLDDVSFFVRDGSLIAFKPYIAISQKEEEVHEFVIE